MMSRNIRDCTLQEKQHSKASHLTNLKKAKTTSSGGIKIQNCYNILSRMSYMQKKKTVRHTKNFTSLTQMLGTKIAEIKSMLS